MGRFDFIGDESLRASLELDYLELQNCMREDTGAWKAAHVLAGSIIEAVLIDHLLMIGYTKADPLKMSLDKVIQACEEENIISERTVHLSHVIRSYRNLIHPGRVLRLKDTADAETAKVAGSLVHIVAQDVSSRKSVSYGYTAEQIVSKLERDTSAIAILPNLLCELNHREIERLLLKVIPERYFEIQPYDDEPPPADTMHALITCFEQTYTIAVEEVRRKLADKFVSLVKEESHYMVFEYSKAFFKAEYIELISSPQDKTIAKKHLLLRLESDFDSKPQKYLSGIKNHLEPADIIPFVDSFVKWYMKDEGIRGDIEAFWTMEFDSEKFPYVEIIKKRLDIWIDHLDKLKRFPDAKLVKQFKDNWLFWLCEN
ncbi:MAG: hypothetical protein RIN56_14425 [Sporomusaceae bacterium]|nr:hypothetical protein [Sporomusaceae bacterium]